MPGRTVDHPLEQFRFQRQKDLEDFGAKLRINREALEITQQQMAGLVGVSQATISRIEAGVETPKSREIALAMAHFYRLDETTAKGWFNCFTPMTLDESGGPEALFRYSQSFLVSALVTSTSLSEEEDERPNWEAARQLIQKWSLSKNATASDLANKSGLPIELLTSFLSGESALDETSALRVYKALEQEIPPFTRRTFLKALGLLSLAQMLGRGLLLPIPTDQDSSLLPIDIGNQFLQTGRILGRKSWGEALPWLVEAERILQPSPGQAARAALETAQMFLNLGDYGQTRSQLLRIEKKYGGLVDPELQSEFHRIFGWLDFYEGNLVEAEHSLLETIEVAQKAGLYHLADHHFLGRVYAAVAQIQKDQETAALYFHKAEGQFDLASKRRPAWTSDAARSYDFFRKAQAYILHGQWQEAEVLRRRARQMLGDDFGVMHVDLEEARLALAVGDLKLAGGNTEQVLSGWKEMNYAKGIADSLKVLAAIEVKKGRTQKAFELYVGALIAYPFENSFVNRDTWSKIEILLADVLGRDPRKSKEGIVRYIEELAQEKYSSFSFLRHISADRGQEIKRVLRKLKSLPLSY